MYIPAQYSEQRQEELRRIIETHPLGILVTSSSDGLDGDHLPFEYDPTRGAFGTLTAHVARANPVWQRCPSGAKVLVMFRGADAYVSPNWYPSKHETHREVPTWNYEAVHAWGTLTVMDEQRFVARAVARLTRRHEAGEPVPWKMSDAAPDFLKQVLQKIVGIEIAVTALQGKSKLSQNKSPRDRNGVVQALSARGQHELSALVDRPPTE